MIDVVLIRCGMPAGSNELLNPPLGLLYLAAYIRPLGYQSHVIDLKVEALSQADIVERIKRIKPELIGLSAFTTEAISLHVVAKKLKSEFPQIDIVAGGPYPTSDPETVLADPSIDYAVTGEGEKTFEELLEKLGNGDDVSQIDGLAYRDAEGRVIQNRTREPIMDLDSLPWPAWELVDIGRYSKYYAATPVGKGAYLPVFTSRGCPYQCSYCHRIFGKRFRARSASNVIAEIEEIRDRFAIKRIEFCDDNFNLDEQRAKKICEYILKRAPGSRLSFSNGLRADLMTKDLIHHMRDAGTYFISYAVESATPRIQRMLKKNIDLPKAREVISLTVDAGIYTNGFFIIGFPTETKEDVKRTISYACSTRLHSMSAFILVPFPGTRIYKEYSSDWKRLHKKDIFDFHSGLVNCSEIPNDELLALKRRMYLEFYFRTGRIVRTLLRHPDKMALLSLGWVVLKRMGIMKHLQDTPKSGNG